jgi:subtilisin family serine protease
VTIRIRSRALGGLTFALLLAAGAGARGSGPARISEQVAAAAEQGPVRAIVLLKEGSSPASSSLSLLNRPERIAPIQQRVLEQLKPTKTRAIHRYRNFAGLAVELEAEGLKRLASDPDVESVGPDRKVRASLVESAALTGVNYARDLGRTGLGITVAVIDTGIDYTHPDLGGGYGPGFKVVAGYNFVNPIMPFQDDNGHGTEMAGVIGSSNSTYRGVAPGAKLIALKVLDATGNGNMSTVAAAVDWSITNKATYNIRVLNLSLGDGWENKNQAADCDTDPTAQSFQAAINAGLVVVAAAGNERYFQGLNYPACVTGVISAGDVYDADEGALQWTGACTDWTTAPDQIVCHCDRASFLGLLAPGAIITSTCLPGTLKPDGTTCGQGDFVEGGGTSNAAAFVSGLVAELLQANPSWTPGDILSILRSSGKPVFDSATGLTFPRVDAGTEFIDVSLHHWARGQINAIRDAGITIGCGPLLYCPAQSVNRAQMALFIGRAIGGLGTYTPAPCGQERFDDIPCDYLAPGTSPSAFYKGIEYIADAEHNPVGAAITVGCDTHPPRYCPDDLVDRAQMALFVGRAIGGLGTYTPALCGQERFDDIPCDYLNPGSPPSAFYKGIEYIADGAHNSIGRPVTIGCGDGSNYCPDNIVTRDQMAVYVARAFLGW